MKKTVVLLYSQKKYFLTVMLLMILAMTGCGRKVDNDSIDAMLPTVQEEVKEQEEPEVQETDAEEELSPFRQEIPVYFPFDESESYSLTLVLQDEDDGEYELRLCDETGEILQQIPRIKIEDPLLFTFHTYKRNGRKTIKVFNTGNAADQSYAWDGERFSKITTGYGGHLTIEYEKGAQIKTIYDGDEEIRRWTLQIDTGELEIWDFVADKSLFKEVVELDEEINPVNQDYYDMLFWNVHYYRSDDDGLTVHDQLKFEDGKWHSVEYESPEAFLAALGFENSELMYQYYYLNQDLYLELYRNRSTGQFCGITYEDYYYNSKGEKRAADIYGFMISSIDNKKWTGEDAYSEMSAFKVSEQSYVKDYEETIKYTFDGLPAYFHSQGVIRTEAGEGLETVMGINYIYRDDRTLFYRSYGHSHNIFPTTYSSRTSYYDEKGRVLYERGYHSNGYLRDYYIYEDEGEMPTYHLNIHYCHGGANPHLMRYH